MLLLCSNCCADFTDVCVAQSLSSPPPQTSESINCTTHGTGDYNLDAELNILDVVGCVNMILSGAEYESMEFCLAATMDMNDDQAVNVLDAVSMINYIVQG